MTLALATFARDEGLDVTHRAVVVVDRAGWHSAGDLRLPEGIDLIFLPAAAPERQPAARLWTLVDDTDRQARFPQPRRAGDGPGRALPASRGRSPAPQSPHPFPLVARRRIARTRTVISRIPYNLRERYWRLICIYVWPG